MLLGQLVESFRPATLRDLDQDLARVADRGHDGVGKDRRRLFLALHEEAVQHAAIAVAAPLPAAPAAAAPAGQPRGDADGPDRVEDDEEGEPVGGGAHDAAVDGEHPIGVEDEVDAELQQPEDEPHRRACAWGEGRGGA